jgi:hypothetical protein
MRSFCPSVLLSLCPRDIAPDVPISMTRDSLDLDLNVDKDSDTRQGLDPMGCLLLPWTDTPFGHLAADWTGLD